MKIVFWIGIMFIGVFAFAQTVAPVVPAANPVAVAIGGSFGLNANTIAIFAIILGGINTVLSVVQQVFSALAKAEPSALQKVSAVILEISKWLGSNTSV